jgi:hypothetical protein
MGKGGEVLNADREGGRNNGFDGFAERDNRRFGNMAPPQIVETTFPLCPRYAGRD